MVFSTSATNPFRPLQIAMAGIDSERFKVAQLSTARFADARYWTSRYSETNFEPFDWHLRWEQIKDFILPLLIPESEILVLGCGTSTLSEQLYLEGYVQVTSTDICAPLIDMLADKHAERASMEYRTVAAQQLPSEWRGRFDVVLDKAVLDSVACSRKKWQDTEAMLRSVSAVLKPQSGVYVCVSHGSPDLRRPMLLGTGRSVEVSETYQWDVEVQTVPRPLSNPVADPKAKDKVEISLGPAHVEEQHVYYIYFCRKCPE